MGNTKLYRENVYARECEATILELRYVTEESASGARRCAELLLEPCIFFPEGGGQKSDSGTVEGYPVSAVFERPESERNAERPESERNAERPADEEPETARRDAPGSRELSPSDTWVRIDLSAVRPETAGPCSDAAFCFGAGPADPSEGGFSLMPGDSVSCRLDWDKRFDNMQRHNGEHIMSGMFYREYGGVNRGFHMGDDYMTVDISMEDPRFPELTWEMLKNVELCTNRAIWDDLPVRTYRFKSREEALAYGIKMRKELPAEMEGEEITIVCIGSPENAADSVFCCGTHPATTGQVGLLKIYKFKKYKGMYRVFFEAGERAFRNLQRDQDALNALYQRFSATPEDILEKAAAREEKHRAKEKELIAELKELKASKN